MAICFITEAQMDEVSSQYFGGKGGIASIRRLSRPSGRIETQDASGATGNPLGLDTSLGCAASARSYSTGAGFVLPRLFEKILDEVESLLREVVLKVASAQAGAGDLPGQTGGQQTN